MVRVAVRVKPGAFRTAVGGQHAGALVITVNAPAVDGRANEAVCAALAAALGLRPRQVSLVSGHRSGTKVLAIELADQADIPALRDQLGHLLGPTGVSGDAVGPDPA